VHLQLQLSPLHLPQQKVRRKLMLRLHLSPRKLVQKLAGLTLSSKKEHEAMLAYAFEYDCQVCWHLPSPAHHQTWFSASVWALLGPQGIGMGLLGPGLNPQGLRKGPLGPALAVAALPWLLFVQQYQQELHGKVVG